MASAKSVSHPGSEVNFDDGKAMRDKNIAARFAQFNDRGEPGMKTNRGPEFYAQIGRRGGESTKRKYGSQFYSEIGRKGGSTTRADRKAKNPAEGEAKS